MKRDFRFFEQWARLNNMLPVCRIETDAGDILIADSGVPFWGASESGVQMRFYRTGFAIDRGDKTWLASTHDYSAVEFDLMSKAEGQKRRTDECEEHAIKCLSQLAETGLFDDARKASFSRRPYSVH